MALTYSRPAKLNHVDTIRYEIDMLRYTMSRLAEQKLTERDAWAYLESFLLHYRNLIDFLGAENPRQTDLHVTTIWQLANLAPPTKLDEIYANGKVLRARYEPTDAEGGGRISQYLQHCTTKRIDAKDWQVVTMYNEVEPLLGQVEQSLGAVSGVLPAVPPAKGLSIFSASTTTGTFTSAAVAFDGGSPIIKKTGP